MIGKKHLTATERGVATGDNLGEIHTGDKIYEGINPAYHDATLEEKNRRIFELEAEVKIQRELNPEEAMRKKDERIAALEKQLGNRDEDEQAAFEDFKSGENDNARDKFERLVEEHKLSVEKTAEYEFALGLIAEDDIRWHDALKHYKRAHELSRDFDRTMKYADFLERLGDYNAAVALYEPLLASARDKGDEKQIGQVSNGLAHVYHLQGRYELAVTFHEETLNLAKRVFGTQHPNTLTSMNNLAGVYYSQERYELAEPLFTETLQTRKRVLGAEHPDTLTSLNNLAGVYDAQGRHELAEQLYKESLSIQKRVLGAEHPHTLTSMNNLAGVYLSQGRYELAEPLYVETLSIQKPVLGTKHPLTIKSMHNLSALYAYQIRYGEAEKLMSAALDMRRKVLGNDHPDTKRSEASLAAIRAAKADQ